MSVNVETLSMKRRTLLAGVGATVVAGCSSSESDTDDTQHTNTSSKTGDGSTDGGDPDDAEPLTSEAVIDPPITIESASINPSHGLELTATAIEPASFESPALVTVELSNTGEESRTIVTSPAPPLPPVGANNDGGDGRLFLLRPDGTGHEHPYGPEDSPQVSEPLEPDERVIPPEPVGGCWQAQTSFGSYPVDHPVTLEPGGSIEHHYALIARDENEPCYPPGVYRFDVDGRIDDERVDLQVVLAVGDGEV